MKTHRTVWNDHPVTLAVMALLSIMLTGCGTGTINGGTSDRPFDDFGRFEPYEATVHTSEASVKANEDFLNRIEYGDGVGDFRLTPLKYGDGIRDCSLIVENGSDYPSGAYITFVMEDEEGNAISAGESVTRTLAGGSRDIIPVNLGDGASEDFEKLVITAWALDNAGDTVFENLEKEGVTEVGNVRTGAGRRIDLKFSEPLGSYMDQCAVFYDSDDNVFTVKSFITSGDGGSYACLYTEFDYARYEITAFKETGQAQALPDSVYKAYQEKGYVAEPGKEYESLDSNVTCSFEELSDGQILIRLSNRTQEPVAVRRDCFLIYGENKRGAKGEPDLVLKPGEELYWDTGLPLKASFWMLPVSANRTEPEEPVPSLELSEKDGHLHYTVGWGTVPADNELEGKVFILYRKDGEPAFCETVNIENDYRHIVEGDASFDGEYEDYEAYFQYHYEVVPQPGV